MATWTTKDGEELEIEEMSDSHLENSYRYFKKRLDDLKKEEDKLALENSVVINYVAKIKLKAINKRLAMLEREMTRREIKEVLE